MSRASMPILLAALGLAGCNLHSADSTGGAVAGEPASAPTSAPANDVSGDFDLRGTTPLWSLIIRPDRILLTRAGVSPQQWPAGHG